VTNWLQGDGGSNILSGNVLSSFGRTATVAAAMVATSGALQATGEPLLMVIVRMAFNLAAAQSEAKKLREKTAMTVIASQHIPRSIEYA
jgi:hypothetical protein